ncbi:MAG: hypothetical protein NTW59_02625 [Candidatus Diapherotrites archaeon]|nr:hypothetical protein [Candidatus Diapherotrites archaeon]
MDQLVFAQRFPFTDAARRIVAEQNLSLERLPEEVVQRAEQLVRQAVSGKAEPLRLQNTDLLLQEILAFPVAKIILSFTKDARLFERFSAMAADNAFSFLNMQKSRQEATVALAKDLRVGFDFAEENGFFVRVPLQEFLQVRFGDPLLKLVNQRVSRGRVFLDLNNFCRFLREKSFKVVLGSLPVPTAGLPAGLQATAKRLQQELIASEKKYFDFAIKGKADANSFPPCMASLYSQLIAGQKLPHMARVYLTYFLNRIGMPKQQILELFKKSPDFKERIASYQINKIVAQNYTPASCDKMRAQGYCPNADCNVRNPLSFYRRELKKKKQPESAAK